MHREQVYTIEKIPNFIANDLVDVFITADSEGGNGIPSL